MRLRAVPLPGRVVGSVVEPNFALVLDRVADDEFEAFGPEQMEELKSAMGASAILVVKQEIELEELPMIEPQLDELTDLITAVANSVARLSAELHEHHPPVLRGMPSEAG